MKVIVNGNESGTKEKGCALCGGKWGDYYEEVDGERFFFCCEYCAKEFINMINEVKKRTGWEKIEELRIKGNYYTGRTCSALKENKEYKFYVKFGDNGDIEVFKEI